MTDRDRDLSVERWLRQTPVAGARSESPEYLDACLDAETLAAWAEGLLGGPARASAEAHASSCARCQAMLAVMARTMPGPAQSSGSPIRKWLMMLGPSVAAAAAVALWLAVDQKPAPSVVGRLSQDEATAARAPESPRPSAASPPAVLEKDADRGAPGASLDREALNRERAAAKELADARKERESRVGGDKSANAAPVAANERSERKDVAASKPVAAPLDSDRLRAAVPAATPPPPPPASLPAPVQSSAGNRTAQANAPPPAAPQPQAGQNQNQNQNQVTPRQQAAPAEPILAAERPAPGAVAGGTTAGRDAAGRGGGAGGFADALQSYRKDARNFDVVGPDASVRWRVVGGRTVQRSLDAGATWADQYSAEDGVTLTAGVAPSSTVCWLVGGAGAIALTTDGRAWQRVKFPEPVDLTAVTSPDARTATVTTADGRRFGTTDGGRSWTRR